MFFPIFPRQLPKIFWILICPFFFLWARHTLQVAFSPLNISNTLCPPHLQHCFFSTSSTTISPQTIPCFVVFKCSPQLLFLILHSHTSQYMLISLLYTTNFSLRQVELTTNSPYSIYIHLIILHLHFMYHSSSHSSSPFFLSSIVSSKDFFLIFFTIISSSSPTPHITINFSTPTPQHMLSSSQMSCPITFPNLTLTHFPFNFPLTIFLVILSLFFPMFIPVVLIHDPNFLLILLCPVFPIPQANIACSIFSPI